MGQEVAPAPGLRVRCCLRSPATQATCGRSSAWRLRRSRARAATRRSPATQAALGASLPAGWLQRSLRSLSPPPFGSSLALSSAATPAAPWLTQYDQARSRPPRTLPCRPRDPDSLLGANCPSRRRAPGQLQVVPWPLLLGRAT